MSDGVGRQRQKAGAREQGRQVEGPMQKGPAKAPGPSPSLTLLQMSSELAHPYISPLPTALGWVLPLRARSDCALPQ